MLAKEVAVFQATFQAFKESQEEGASDAKVNIGGTSKQLQDLYAQQRKLQADVFDALKNVKANPSEVQGTIERERESYKT